MEQNTLFSKSNTDKVKSPDNLGEYIRVANPSVWILLVSILSLLLGILCWGIFGTIRTEVRADARCENGEVVCYLTDDAAARVKPGMHAIIGQINGQVTDVTAKSDNQSTCLLLTETPLDDGIYTAIIEIESIHPISFLVN